LLPKLEYFHNCFPRSASTKFTKTAVAALTLPAGKTDHFEWDDATSGFGIRLREGGKPTWTAQIRFMAAPSGSPSVMWRRLEPARTAAKKFSAEATLGQDPAKARAGDRAKAAVNGRCHH
jgi:hypothetical protein